MLNSVRRPLRTLVIGAGPAAVTMHLPVLARLRDRGDIILATICDLESGRAAAARRKFGFLDDSASAPMMRADIDVVYLFANAQAHYDLGMGALCHGKHLFVEKPIAPSFAQAQELAREARLRGLVAVGGHNRRFFPSLAAVRARGGKAGWQFAEATFHKAETGRGPAFGAASWLGANGIHALDTLVYMMDGLPEHIAAQSDGVSIFSALMRWPQGRQGVFLCNNMAGARHEEYVFHALGQTCRANETTLAVEKPGAVTMTAFRAGCDGVLAEHEAFLQAIHEGTSPAHAIAALAPSLWLAERIEQGFCGTLEFPVEPQACQAAVSQNAAKSVLVVSPEGLQSALAQYGAHIRIVSPAEVESASAPRADIIAALLGRNASPLPQALLAKLPNLALVGFAGLSMAHLQVERLLAQRVALAHASNAYAESVAEFALGLAILGRRRAFVSHGVMRTGGWGTDMAMRGGKGVVRRAARQLRPVMEAIGLEPLAAGAWNRAKPLMNIPDSDAGAPRDLCGASVGLIGWSANARAFARRLSQAGAVVKVWSERASASDTGGLQRVSLGQAMAADIVSLHRGLTPATRHFLGASELEHLQPGALLINVARGPLIEPAALLARLARGDILACLDTFEEEPLAAPHPLRALPNVFLTSHIAGGSPDMHAAAADEIVGKVAGYLNGGAIDTISAARLHAMS